MIINPCMLFTSDYKPEERYHQSTATMEVTVYTPKEEKITINKGESWELLNITPAIFLIKYNGTVYPAKGPDLLELIHASTNDIFKGVNY